MFNVIRFVLVEVVNIKLGNETTEQPLRNDSICANPVSRHLVFSLNPSDSVTVERGMNCTCAQSSNVIGHVPRISKAFNLKWSYKVSDLNKYLNASTIFGGRIFTCKISYNFCLFYIHGSVHRDSVLIRSNKMQQYAGVYLLQVY